MLPGVSGRVRRPRCAGVALGPVPEHERSLAQVGEIWELLVVTHPGYDRFDSDGQCGWAHKSESTPPASRLLVKSDVVGAIFSVVRTARARIGPVGVLR